MRKPRLRPRSKDQIWEVAYIDADNIRRRHSTGTKDKRAAEELFPQIVADLQKPRIPDSPTIRWLADQHYKDVENTKNPAQIDRLRWNLKSIVERLGGLRADQIDQRVIDDYATWRVAQPRKGHGHKSDAPAVEPTTARRELVQLRALLNDALTRRYIAQAVHFKINIPTPRPRDTWLTKNEVERMLDACLTSDGDVQPKRLHLYRFILIAVNTAARAGAIFDLKWKNVHLPEHAPDVELKGRTEPGGEIKKVRYNTPGSGLLDWTNATVRKGAYIDFGEGVGNKMRGKMPITSWRLATEMMFGERTSEYVVTRAGKSDRCRNVNNGLKTLADESGISSNVSQHVLKHTAVTWMVQAGMSPEALENLIGTSAKTIKKVYAHNNPDHHEQLVEASI